MTESIFITETILSKWIHTLFVWWKINFNESLFFTFCFFSIFSSLLTLTTRIVDISIADKQYNVMLSQIHVNVLIATLILITTIVNRDSTDFLSMYSALIASRKKRVSYRNLSILIYLSESIVRISEFASKKRFLFRKFLLSTLSKRFNALFYSLYYDRYAQKFVAS